MTVYIQITVFLNQSADSVINTVYDAVCSSLTATQISVSIKPLSFI